MKIIFALLATLSMAFPAIAADGMISIQSAFPVEITADRFENILNQKGMTVFSRIKHSESAQKIGIDLRKTELVIFGNPKVGSPLMQCQQTVAIDLPQKALIWEDDKGSTWISYNDPSYLVQRHNIPGCNEIISKIENALATLTKAAATK